MKTTYVLTWLPEPSSIQTADAAGAVDIENMAPVPHESSPSYISSFVVGGHLLSVIFLSLIAGRTIYRSYLALPPSSATRHREPLRKGHVKTFSILAALSLLVASFWSVKFASLSYRVWAAERGIDLPHGIFGDNGGLRPGEHPGRLHIVRWLSDTPLYRDSLEIVAEKARHFWWAQQVNLGLISWSMYMTLEGQRRQISHLWAFLALAQLVNLSFAQNLFFVAVLLTPVPLPENVRDLTSSSVPGMSNKFSHILGRAFPQKAHGFLPRPTLYITLLLSSFATLFLVPFSANTTSFGTVSAIARILPFSFLALPYIIPTSWGSFTSHPHDSHSTYIKIFGTIATYSALLHAKSTASAFFYNLPESTDHRHSLLHPFREEHRSALNRGTTAVARVFGAVNEHPAVSAIGWDVLLSGVSLGIWAAIRGLDSSTIFRKRTAKGRTEEVLGNALVGIKEETEKSLSKVDEVLTQPRRRAGRPKKSESAVPANKASGTSTRGTPSRRSVRNASRTEDEAYEPSGEVTDEGDEDAEEDLEMAALAWGLITAGGLGLGSAAVYGAETTSR